MTWFRKKNIVPPQADADKALQESLMHLHETVRDGHAVRRMAERLRDIQRENHFAESIRNVYTGGDA